ncbi:conserved phage C-terminal domain-containing protein [Lactobacillus mulieris]|uniref:conserved phage C-terminal domain-containing protein n=1 Tax=Lactobacillus mulieris TaxID=2508708 RepID=UPI0022AC0356|nr:conserved phage C-terminal domain-containing protein [Lactobacillus mulieris]MCZ3690632.1 conserved phage C-terminal domain-containing protein [Lactobacillus mulieris]MCZ3696592.1 conserved phage C-terminal domain-containing protein [Lactobacillus mulieris]MCZ3704283.1 conserved phage C-terminal domain-containing protein [Lactobacillus mulieris]MCZ3705876.1 conserved phage C-terminal domain-containing protein [Lactobacillus mulieris]MCZ3707534.1 conserved phage C-terminal domain-containing 
MGKLSKKFVTHFTTIPNSIAQNDQLSWKARGIFLYLASKPSDWQFYEIEVARHSIDGRDALRTGLKELENNGYLKRYRKRNEKGQVVDSEWILSDVPMSDEPVLNEPMYENPTQVNPTIQNKDLTKKDNTKKRNTKYSLAEPDNSSKKVDNSKQVKAIVQFLNEKTGSHYRASSAKTKKLIHARLKEGFTVDDFEKVIVKKCKDWKIDTKMAKYLRPETLFGTKFESYLNEIDHALYANNHVVDSWSNWEAKL